MTRLRGLRWVAGGAVAAVVASAAGAVAASAGDRAGHPSASRGCYPKGGSTTIAQDKVGRFYFSKGSKGFMPSVPYAGWYVCGFKQGTPSMVPAGGRGPAPLNWTAKVAGRYAAFFFVGGEFNETSVRVFDMVTGNSNFCEGHDPPICEAPRSRVGGLVLKADASVAWITGVSSSTGTTWYVHRHDSNGTTTVVDSGPGIDPYSLAAGGSWLYWTDAGSPRSAPFH